MSATKSAIKSVWNGKARQLRRLLYFCPIIITPTFAQGAAETEAVLPGNLGAELVLPNTKQRFSANLGEDLGKRLPSQGNGLSQVVVHMQTAQTLLGQSDTSTRASSAQAKAITGLDAVIAQLTERQRQCQGGQCQAGQCKPGQCKSGQCDKPGQPKSSKPGASGKAGKSTSQAASSAINSNADLSTELAVAGELIKDLWGKLPERQRQQILQPLREEFLPKYASEIEAYFRALADPIRTPPESR